jgi:hypothetical protein
MQAVEGGAEELAVIHRKTLNEAEKLRAAAPF